MIVQGIEGAGADQGLDDAAIDHALVHAPAEIKKVAERSVHGAGGNDGLDRGLTGALDAAETVANALRVDRLEAVI